jgi:hypothetical protein
MFSKGPNFDMHLSTTLKPTAKHPYCWDWLKSNAESTALLSGLLQVIHPELFQIAHKAMKKLEVMDEADDLVNLWTSVFNGCLVPGPEQPGDYNSSG